VPIGINDYFFEIANIANQPRAALWRRLGFPC